MTDEASDDFFEIFLEFLSIRLFWTNSKFHKF